MIGIAIVTVIVVAKQVVAQQSAGCCISKPDIVVVKTMAALNSVCNAHTVARISDGKHAVAEEEPNPETGGCEADGGPFVGHGFCVGREWGKRRLNGSLVLRTLTAAIAVLTVARQLAMVSVVTVLFR